MNNKMPLLNPDSIASLRELSEPGKDFYAEMATLYLQQAPGKVADMEAKLAARDFSGISGIAHQLKSSSANLGAMGLSELFLRMEDGSKLKDVENLLRIFPELKKTFSAVQTELNAITSGTGQQAA